MSNSAPEFNRTRTHRLHAATIRGRVQEVQLTPQTIALYRQRNQHARIDHSRQSAAHRIRVHTRSPQIRRERRIAPEFFFRDEPWTPALRLQRLKRVQRHSDGSSVVRKRRKHIAEADIRYRRRSRPCGEPGEGHALVRRARPIPHPASRFPHPSPTYADSSSTTIRSSKRDRWLRNRRWTTPVGPLRCFATINFVMPSGYGWSKLRVSQSSRVT